MIGTIYTRCSVQEILAEVVVSDGIEGALVIELLHVLSNHPGFPFLRLRVHLMPRHTLFIIYHSSG